MAHSKKKLDALRQKTKLLNSLSDLQIQIIENFSTKGVKTSNDVLLVFMFLFISGFQSILFAMWMDIQDNNRLYKT